MLTQETNTKYVGIYFWSAILKRWVVYPHEWFNTKYYNAIKAGIKTRCLRTASVKRWATCQH